MIDDLTKKIENSDTFKTLIINTITHTRVYKVNVVYYNFEI